MMKLINLHLGKWATNGEQLKAIWRAEGQRWYANAGPWGSLEHGRRLLVYWRGWNYLNVERRSNDQEEAYTINSKLLRPIWIVFSGIPHREDTFLGHGAEASTGTSSCSQTLEHNGTFGYLVWLHYRKCMSLDGWLLRETETPKITYFVMPPIERMEWFSTFVWPSKKTHLPVWPCSKNRLAPVREGNTLEIGASGDDGGNTTAELLQRGDNLRH